MFLTYFKKIFKIRGMNHCRLVYSALYIYPCIYDNLWKGSWFGKIDWFIVFNATFSNISAISWRSVLLVEEAGVPGENNRPWVSNW